MNPDTLQTFGVLAIGIGFVLIGFGGFVTYHSSQVVQHQSEMRQVEQKGEMNAQILTLMMKNQELQGQELQRAEQAAAAAQAAVPAPPAYYRPPSPPPPNIYPASAPPPIAEEPPQAAAPEPYPQGPQQTAPPAAVPEPQVTPIVPIIPGAPAETRNPSDWEEPDSFAPQQPGRYLTVHQQHVIADTLRAHGRHLVTLESSYGDPVSREFAEELAKAFAEANWLVAGITEHQGLPLASGVTVSAASFPPAPETRAMYEALLSAGIAVTQQLKPKQHNGETVVLVGTPL